MSERLLSRAGALVVASAFAWAGGPAQAENVRGAPGNEDVAGSVPSLVDAVLRNPNDLRARSYLARATERIREERVSSLSPLRREALSGGARDLERARVQVAFWRASLAEAREAQARGRWVFACDRYLGVLRENPRHGDAVDGLRQASRAIAERLDVGGLSDVKAKFLYGAFFYYLQGERKKAKAAFARALAFDKLSAELSESDIIRYYNDMDTSGPLTLALRPPLALEARSPMAGRPHAPAPVENRVRKTAEPPTAQAPVPARPEPPDRPASPPKAVKAAGPTRPKTAGMNFVLRRADGLFRQAAALRREGKLEEAARIVGELLSIAPDHPKGAELEFEIQEALRARHGGLKAQAEEHYRAGLTHYGFGRLEEARAELEKAVAADPEDAYAADALVKLRRELAEANPRLLREGMSPRQASGELKAQAEEHYRAGLAHYGVGRLEEARAELEKAVAADPEHAYAADALLRLNKELAEKRP